MDFISEKFIFARTGEPLEKRMQKSDKFQQQANSLHRALKAFTEDSGISKECWKLFCKLEEEWTKYNIQYGEESYHLGFEDGVKIVSEKEIRFKGSILDFKDMTHLIYVYDALKKLNKLLFGEWEIHNGKCGILGELDRVYDVIENGVCAEIRLYGEDESYECLTDILDDVRRMPEERAKILTGQSVI